MDQENALIRAGKQDALAKIEKLRSAFEPLRLEMIEGTTQYDRNWELFVDAVLDLLGEEDSETQFTNFLRS